MPLPEQLLAPIEGENPSGTSVRYESVYDQIKEARRDEMDLPQGAWETEPKRADWNLVIRLASDVLTKQSKDLQIAAWLGEALLHRDGMPGLHDGLGLLHALLDTFWDTLHPEIEDGDPSMRSGPLGFVGGKLDAAVRLAPLDASGHSFMEYRETRKIPYEAEARGDNEKKKAREKALAEGGTAPETVDSAIDETPKAWYKQLLAGIDGSLAEIEALDDIADKRFDDFAPSFIPLRDAIREVRPLAAQLLARKLELEPDPVEVDPVDVAADAVAEGAAPGEGGPATVTLSVTPRSREDAASRIAAAARFMRAETPTDPAPYLLLRGFRWGELRAGGGALDPKLFVAPPTDVRTRLKTLLLDGRWKELLEAGEEVMATAQGRGWLDLQRYILTACAELGTGHDVVAGAIRGALRSLLRDLPQLPDMTLMDDSPTANAETRAWLRDNGLFAADGEEDEAPVISATPRSRRDAYDRALDQVKAGQPQRGIEVLMREATVEKSERARFLRRSQAASIMVDHGLEAVAMPILQELVQQVEKHGLEEWESGDTVAQALGLLYRSMTALNVDPAGREKLYLRVCRLDPMQAITFNTAKPDAAQGT